MATYMMLGRFTDVGSRSIKESPERIGAFKSSAQSVGCEVREVFLALGQYDVVLLAFAPNDEVMAKLTLTLRTNGQIRTETLRLFSESDLRAMTAKL